MPHETPKTLEEFEAGLDGEKRAVSVNLDDVITDETTDEIIVRGHAAVFDEMSNDLGGFREVIRRGAFRKLLSSNPDIALLYNHDWNTILARTRTGSLTVREDPKGLHVEARLDATDPDVQRILPKMRRGDLDQMSFAFRTTRGGIKREVRGGEIIRNVMEVSDMSETSIVGRPAYPQTLVRLENRFSLPDETRDAIVEEIRNLSDPNPDPAEELPPDSPVPAGETGPEGMDEAGTQSGEEPNTPETGDETAEARSDTAFWANRIERLRLARLER